MKRSLLVIVIMALYLLHQDFWFWRATAPIVFGFLPIGLFYHLCYTLLISVLMWLLVRQVWPSHLETERLRDGETERRRDGGTERRRDGETERQQGKDAALSPSRSLSVSQSLRLSVPDPQEGRDS